MIWLVCKKWSEFNENRFALSQWLTEVEKNLKRLYVRAVWSNQLLHGSVSTCFMCWSTLGEVNWIVTWPHAWSSGLPVVVMWKAGERLFWSVEQSSQSMMAVQVGKRQALPCVLCVYVCACMWMTRCKTNLPPDFKKIQTTEIVQYLEIHFTLWISVVFSVASSVWCSAEKIWFHPSHTLESGEKSSKLYF